MCGIVGLIKHNGDRVFRKEMEKLNKTLYHRGPDEEGYFIEDNIGLAMRRLSIIDIDGGHQPMISLDGNYVIVFNGEIYNYQELRKELKALGHTFSTASDTEVILKGYIHWGPDVLSKMNGMWSIAIFDRKRKELFLSRDRLGKKQLYYAIHDQFLIFGSEMKIPMMYHQDLRRLRVSSLPEYLTYGYIGGPETAVEGIRLLPEGSWAVYGQGQELTIKKFWDIADYCHPREEKLSLIDAAEESYALLKDAVKKRLVSDVPVSVMLSSGLDSSSCAYIIAKDLNANLKTFSLGYDDNDFDESQDAGELARRLNLPWEKGMIDGSHVEEELLNYIHHCDSLQSNTGQLVYYFVTKMIHDNGYKVSINGGGGDELFAGYQTYRADTLFNWYRKIPSLAKKGIAGSVSRLSSSFGRVSIDYMMKKFTECPYHDPFKAHGYWRTMFSPWELNDLLSPDVAKTSPSFTSIYDDAFGDIGGETLTINKLLCSDMKAWLIPMMPWVDNVSMAHSVELRLPFLDYRLVEYALSLPSHLLFNGWTLKGIMKQFLKGRLPHDVLHRKKRGTHLPVSLWLNGELMNIVDYYLDEQTLNADSLFNMVAVKQLIEQHRNFEKDNTFKIWNLLIFSLWKECFLVNFN